MSGCSSGVEHNLAKVGVEGSNPFARSSFFLRNCKHDAALAVDSLHAADQVKPHAVTPFPF